MFEKRSAGKIVLVLNDHFLTPFLLVAVGGHLNLVSRYLVKLVSLSACLFVSVRGLDFLSDRRQNEKNEP